MMDEFDERCYALQRELNRTMTAHVDSLPPGEGALIATTVTFSLMALIAANVNDDDTAAIQMICNAPWDELIKHSRAAIKEQRARCPHQEEPPP